MPDAAQAEAVKQARRKRSQAPAKSKADEAREKLGVISPFTGKWTGDSWASPEKRRMLPPVKRA